MTTALMTKRIWPALRQAARKSKSPCYAAVAYFGEDASELLPLKKNSRLVVDASEKTVKLGLTCPADLIKLVGRGVKIFSVRNLHAKVFVLGNTAYIGSANVSKNSAHTLVEAVVRTNESRTVQHTKDFVKGLCVNELGPKVLERLKKLYRPPRITEAKKGIEATRDTADRPTLPKLRIVQLILEAWSDRDQSFHDAGLPAAKRRQKHPKKSELDSFRWRGTCPMKSGDKVLQVTDEGGGNVFVSPPGTVLYVRRRRVRSRRVSFVYLERPTGRRRQVKVLARTLGRGSLMRLRRDGVVRDVAFAQRLLIKSNQ